MKSMYVKIVVSILVLGLLAACGAQPTQAPASTPAPTEEVAPATEAPTEPPAVTEAPTEAAATEPAAATQTVPEGPTVSFSTDILPIFESRCIGCHGGERTQEGLDLKTHASLMAGSNNGFVVTPGDSASSLLVELVTNQKMPKRGPKLTPPQVQLIAEWVNQGAQDN
jgi:mono/diheme cytochrome c family protein